MRHMNLTQIVNKATRHKNILDKIFTNCSHLYTDPEILSPMGKSDHNCVLLRPKLYDMTKISTTKLVKKRSLKADTMTKFSSAINNIRWHEMYSMEDCVNQAEFFYTKLISLIDEITPVETVKFKASDRPWVTPYFKKLISSRDAAFVNGNTALFKSLRNRVNRIRKSLQKQYYLNKIDDLKTDNPAKWWKNLKQICRLDKTSDSCFDNIQFHGKPSAAADLPEAINSFLVGITSHIPGLDTPSLTRLRNSLPQVPDEIHCLYL